MKSCIDIAFFDHPGCCYSCHEDLEEYHIDMCELEHEGETYHLCCTMYTWFEKQIEKEKIICNGKQ